MSNYDDDTPRYRTVAERQANAAANIESLRNQGYTPQPIEVFRTKKIAQSFWGHAWCRHLESYSDYESRLPPGRSYVRNGSVCHLEIKSGCINAFVSGTELYEIKINIDQLPTEDWTNLKKRCSGKIGSLLELLQGKLSDEVMTFVTDLDQGLFPNPNEIHLDCNCPDHADLCKHLASVLYGVGIHLDEQPELLFLLRGVDHKELIEANSTESLLQSKTNKRRRIATDDLSNVFGVEISTTIPPNDNTIDLPTPKVKKPPKRPTQKKQPVSDKPNLPPSPKTGKDIRKLRQKFGMTEYEFGFMMDLSAETIHSWESTGNSSHEAQTKHQQELDTIVTLTKPAAWERYNEYL